MTNRTTAKKINFKNTILGGAIICIVVLFCSCENFLKAQDTRNEIISAIDYANAKSYLIKVEAAKGSGTIVKPVGGEISKKVTDSFNIVFEPAKDYQFVRWEAKSEKLPEGANIKDYIKIEEPGSLETTVTFTKELSDIIIYANCPRIPYADVWIDGSNGKLSPAKGTHTVNQNESNYISFEADGDFAFIKWQIYDSTTGNELQNGLYLEIEDPSAQDTNFKLVNVPADQAVSLAIKPLVLERPQVISATPVYDSKGAYRDARIQVMFDSDIDPASIYYTTDEYKALKDELGLEENDFLKIDLGTTAQPDIKYYGYTKNNNTVFKNIQIVNNKTYANLLDHFEKPRFEGSRRLIIYPKKDNLPPGGTTYLITLDKNFSYLSEADKKPVNMREAKKWIYFVNSETDQTPPSVSKIEIRDANDDPVSTDFSTYSFLNGEKKLKFRVAVTDFDSGPSPYFSMMLESTEPGITLEKPIPIYYEEVEEGYASCGNVYNEDANNGKIPKTYYEYILTELPEQDGKYKFSLKFYDNSVRDGVVYKNQSGDTVYFYICIDTTAPNVTTRTVDTCDDSENSLKTGITFKYECADTDLAEAKLYYRPAIATTAANWNNWSNATPVNLEIVTTETTKTITGLDYGAYYEIKVDFFDNARNLTSYLFKKRTLPEVYSTTCEVNEEARCIRIDADHYALGADETILSYKSNRDTDYTTVSYTECPDGIFYIRNIDHASTYEIKLYSKNSESVTEECYENKGFEKENEFETVVTSAIDTRPLRFNRILSSSKVEDGKYKYTFSYENKFKEYSGGVKYSYAKYNNNGNLGTPTTGTWDDLTIVNNTVTQFPALYFDLNSHYYIKFEPFYKKPDGQLIYCSSENTRDYDFWTTTTQTIPAVSNIQIVNITATTATVTWEINDTVPFENYKLVLKKNSTVLSEAILPNTVTSFTITGLDKRLTSPAQYLVSVTRHAEDGSSSPSKSTEKFAVKADVEPGISDMSPDAPSDNKSIKFKGGSQFIAKSGTSYDKLNNQCTYDSNTQCFIVSDSSSTENQIYYVRLYNDNNEPVSKMFAIRAPYKKGTNSYYCLSSFSYEVNTKVTTDNVTLVWHWKDNNYPAEKFYIYYREVGASGWTSATSEGFTNTKTQQKITLVQGKDYDIRFGGSSAVSPATGYAAGYVSVPPATTNFVPQSDSITSNSVVLKWNSAPGSTIFDWFNVYEVSETNPVLVADHINKSATSTKLTLLKPSTTYKYIVCYHRVGETDNTTNSSNLSVTTSEQTGTENGSGNGDLPVVTNLKLDTSSTDPYKVTWTSAGNGYKHKVEYKKASDSSWTSVNSISTNEYSFANLVSGTEYQVQVRSVKAGEQSNPNELRFYTKPNAAVFNDSQITRDSITLNWTNPSGGYSKILVYYEKSGYRYYIKQFNSSHPITSATITDLEPNTQYNFRILTVAGTDESYNPTTATASIVYKTLE